MRQHTRHPAPAAAPTPQTRSAPAAVGDPSSSDPSGFGVGTVPLPAPVRHRRGLDWMGLGGLILAFGLVAGALALGGHGNAFFNLPSALIVVGGTVAVTLVTFPREDIGDSVGRLWAALTRPLPDLGDVAGYVLQMAQAARRDGPRHLAPLLRDRGVAGVQARALDLVLEGVAADDMERVLRMEIDGVQARDLRAAAVLRRASDVAPAMGLIGTLAGLVQMLGNLQDPAAIGPAMAIALLTTFYGALLGNMVFAPLAAKLERKADGQALIDSLFMLGATSIARQESPGRLAAQLNAVLPPHARQSLPD